MAGAEPRWVDVPSQGCIARTGYLPPYLGVVDLPGFSLLTRMF